MYFLAHPTFYLWVGWMIYISITKSPIIRPDNLGCCGQSGINQYLIALKIQCFATFVILYSCRKK